MAIIHLIFGRVGSGKTTYARALARDRRAALFCLDEWMATLFMMEAPSPITLGWALPRTERAETQIWAVARQWVSLGHDAVFELGFFTRAQRDRVQRLAAAVPVATQAHLIEAPVEVRRARVRARNRGGETLTVQVDDAMFDWSEAYFEDLGADEQRGAIQVTTG